MLNRQLSCLIPTCAGLLWPALLSANTAIIAVYNPDFVVIGADSLLVAAKTQRHQFECKIGETNNIFWASAGVNKTVLDAPVNFDINQIASEAVKSSYDFDSAITGFESRTRTALVPLLEWEATSNVSYFTQHLLGQTPVSIVFAGIDHNRTRMSTVEFKLGASSNAVTVVLKTSRRDCPSSDCITPAALGTYEDMQAEAAREPDIWHKPDVVSAIRKLIAVEIAHQPDIVGGPLTILQITRSGVSWPEVGECQTTQPN